MRLVESPAEPTYLTTDKIGIKHALHPRHCYILLFICPLITERSPRKHFCPGHGIRWSGLLLSSFWATMWTCCMVMLDCVWLRKQRGIAVIMEERLEFWFWGSALVTGDSTSPPYTSKTVAKYKQAYCSQLPTKIWFGVLDTAELIFKMKFVKHLLYSRSRKPLVFDEKIDSDFSWKTWTVVFPRMCEPSSYASDQDFD